MRYSLNHRLLKCIPEVRKRKQKIKHLRVGYLPEYQRCLSVLGPYMCSKEPPIKCFGVQGVALKRWGPALNLQVSHSSLNKSAALIPPHNLGIAAAVSYTAQKAPNTLIMWRSANNSSFLYSNRILFFLQLSSAGIFEQEFTTAFILSSIHCTSFPRECSPLPVHRARQHPWVTQTAYSDWCWQKLNLDHLFNSSHHLKRLQPKIKSVPFEVGRGEGCCFPPTKDNF